MALCKIINIDVSTYNKIKFKIKKIVQNQIEISQESKEITQMGTVNI
jgi:hypothetical protein